MQVLEDFAIQVAKFSKTSRDAHLPMVHPFSGFNKIRYRHTQKWRGRGRLCRGRPSAPLFPLVLPHTRFGGLPRRTGEVLALLDTSLRKTSTVRRGRANVKWESRYLVTPPSPSRFVSAFSRPEGSGGPPPPSSGWVFLLLLVGRGAGITSFAPSASARAKDERRGPGTLGARSPPSPTSSPVELVLGGRGSIRPLPGPVLEVRAAGVFRLSATQDPPAISRVAGASCPLPPA